ncbi:hypothetical protein AC579_5121 [Pseudocercospora musae]|uniref:RRM domain-containing protein n=1 Tax=Pseudocercospora musae TaxID=113226 RepID=A0A139IPG3_9PEZI|nr:hypothetical protein AC579_5121 [Pseudocercospora musae]
MVRLRSMVATALNRAMHQLGNTLEQHGHGNAQGGFRRYSIVIDKTRRPNDCDMESSLVDILPAWPRRAREADLAQLARNVFGMESFQPLPGCLHFCLCLIAAAAASGSEASRQVQTSAPREYGEGATGGGAEHTALYVRCSAEDNTYVITTALRHMYVRLWIAQPNWDSAAKPDIEEAYLKAQPNILSPASPKPIHFPQPSNIPVLDNMMDVGFNQTEAHMDAARDTELRPGAWRDPNESADQPSPFSTGGDAAESTNKEDDSAQIAESSQNDNAAHSTQEPLSNGHDGGGDDDDDNDDDDAAPVQTSNDLSYAANSNASALATAIEAPSASSDPSVPTETADASHAQAVEQTQPTPLPSAVNVQALLETLKTSMTPSQPQAQQPALASAPDANASSPVSGVVASPSGLPPRPPPQEQPLMNPNYVHSQHIRDYHPHAANPATQATHASQPTQSQPSANPAEALSNSFAPQFANGANYAPQQSPAVAFSPTQPVNQGQAQQIQQQYSTTNTPIESRREFKIAAGETPTLEDQPWTADIQRKYDHFMEEERRYVNEARWDQFPNGSRLFVGNLSSEKVTKRDIFHVFHTYGELAQISIKQAYGFVQFLRTEDCMRALNAEQGRQIRDKRIHLEISKPQKPSRNQQPNQSRRSRSPDNRNRQNGGRYDGGRGGRRDGRDSRDDRNSRGYRPLYRSPSPRDRYNDRYRTRSRSPGYGRGYRANSPRRDPDDNLNLPRREPRDVPDVQVIALEPLNRDFLSWVEKAFSSRNVRVDVLTISPRLSEEAVVRRQIMEGVIAICKLRHINQDTSKIGLTIFKRRGGTRDVQFEEYDNLEPHICAELVIRERQSLGMNAPQPSYGGYSGQQYSTPAPPQQYGYQQPPAPAPAAAPYSGLPPGYPPGYGQPSSSGHYGAQPPAAMPPPGYPPQPPVDSHNLQNLLSTLNTASPAAPPRQPYGMPPQPGYPPAQPYQGQHYPPTPNAAGAPQQPPPGQTPQNMQDILARLSTYRQ